MKKKHVVAATEPEETCVLGNKTVTRGQSIKDGCSKVCICEAGGYLKCQPRCPPNETVSTVNQHERCVVLSDPRYIVFFFGKNSYHKRLDHV